jgi:HECT-domain (ubiquitin-transferase)
VYLIFPSDTEFIHEDYLIYYRFLGRVMGKALFDRQLVAGHMAHFLYKHMLGWPIVFRDINTVDEEYYSSLKQLQELAQNGEDISMLCLDFSTTQEVMGVKEVIDLIENGQDIEVDNDNFLEYLEACFKYRMLERIKPQLNELLLGFYDVIPEPLLTVFDFQELELLMCGLPEIDLDDWKEHTEYSGDYENTGAEAAACQWFWQVVSEFDQEMKARLLQFVTGTSGVPSRGFGVLQGNDGNIRKFTIHGVSLETCLYPRAHTCFNRIDLPQYETMDDLRDRLKLAVTMVATGFDIE